MAPPALLAAADVAARLQISRRSAYQLMRELREHVRFGRAIRLPEWALQKWIERGGDRNLARPIRPPSPPVARLRITQPRTRPLTPLVPTDAPLPFTSPRSRKPRA